MQDTLKPIDRDGDFITGVKPKRRKIRGPELTLDKKVSIHSLAVNFGWKPQSPKANEVAFLALANF